jgi:hypothetical protein
MILSLECQSFERPGNKYAMQMCFLPFSSRVAQWLERQAQRSDDRFESYSGTWVPVIRMRPYKPRSRVEVGVAR